ncbi:ATP-binding sensor histidine kinase [Polyangium sp. y55x31]|uniref:trifunctional serine/threonine-protein kinase/ATP-binding protein/sensor histidine kinase n=1 Tax=Polyangium sp. y55x31 TaxID=3042688 RepID=UPI002482A4CB|nr:ATP-binding sensor histidine kinase [Polyangium sp. y55x31]MDI1482485.1 AAA family ATPase [Polyangium sp. y55x31]
MSLFPGYEITSKLHETTRTLVYRGRRTHDGLPVVLKTLRLDRPRPEELARFRREYEITSGLGVDGVIRTHGLLRHDGRLAIVLEDFGAEPLSAFRARERLPIEELLPLMVGLARTLGEIHGRNIIHKDVNPSNIVIHPGTREIKLIDFGIATALSRESAPMRDLNVLEGTLRYVSPEQTGRTNRAVDHRADLYSLGITFYELLTGHVPFESSDVVELVHQHIAREPVPPHERAPGIPAVVSEITRKLLAKSPEDRYQTAFGLAADLEACVAALDAGRPIERFPLGRRDVPDKLQIPQKLYGREQEITKLLSTFDRVSEGKAEVVLVAGYSGVGKSALVNEVHEPILAKRGYFVSGKFDQLNRDVPYSSLIQAFRDLVRQFLTESEGQLAVWQKRLSAALGSNGQVILDVIPEVELIVGAQPPISPLPANEAQNRFHFVFQSFVRALTAGGHPLVIFLDDLQWADSPSLKLLQLLVTDPDMKHLLVIGAYRDNEVGSGHPLRMTLEALEKASAPVTELSLSPLSIEHVQRLLDDAVRSGESTLPLAEIALEKTGGNPFFLGQFLRSLADERLLRFEPQAAQWRWDLAEIRRRDMTDNVVELMAAKIQRLPARAQRVLELAACIGARFELATLAKVHDEPLIETATGLWDALREGLVVPIGDAYQLAEPAVLESSDGIPDAHYKFLHDRVQQAAYSLIEEHRRAEIHLQIGRLLLERTPPGQLEERLFDVISQLDQGSERIESPEERAEVARLNLLAGKKAKASAAYEPALHYLAAGIRLLPPGSFSDRYELAFELYVEATGAAYLNGDFERAQKLSQIALEHARTALDKVRIHELRMLFHTARIEFDATIRVGLQALELLGAPLPEDIDTNGMLARYAETAALIGDRPVESLADLPEMVDPTQLARLRLLVTLTAPVYIGKPMLFVPIVCEMVTLCVEHGHAALSPFAFAEYGVVRSAFGDPDAGNLYGDLALRLVDRFDARAHRAKIYTLVGSFIKIWKEHLRVSFDFLREAVTTGLDVGDHEFVGYSAAIHASAIFYAGEPLDVVVADVAQHIDVLSRVKQEHGLSFARIVRQTVLNLMGKSKDPVLLVGESIDERTAIPHFLEVKSENALGLLHISKCMLAYLFGDTALAIEEADAARPYLNALTGHMTAGQLPFYHSLALLRAARVATPENRAALLARVDENQALVKRWADKAPANYLHKYELVEAERARLSGRASEAMDLFERAIKGATKNGFVQEEALAYELAAEHYLELGRTKIAATYMGEARYGYVRWGASAKVAALNKEHAELLGSAAPPPPSTAQGATVNLGVESTTGSGGESIDLATVMKAARAISGEIVLERLSSTLMRILLENAGAQRGFLILEREGQLCVAVEHTIDQADVITHDATPLDREPRLSGAIVKYVSRTRESVVLRDAAREGRFTADPYIASARPKSVLCAPLIDRGAVTAIIYLENNLIAGAFTASRLDILRLLLSQAALSLHNARLFSDLEKTSTRLKASKDLLEEYSRTLEQKVDERTRELSVKNAELGSTLEQLRDTQQQLVMQEKLASLGALTAGIAHEMKNPLNFIINFAELSSGLVTELDEGLAQLDGAAPDTLEEIQETLSLLRQNVAKIGEHGVRANHIVNGMLLHSRAGGGKHEPADLNAALAEGLDLAYHGYRGKTPGFHLKIENDCDPSIGPVEIAVQDMVRVFINVVNNACYAMQDKQRTAGPGYTPTLGIRTRGDASLVEVRIRDNGTGIQDEILGKVFNPFFTTKPPGEGTGLGLSICYDTVVQGHRGTMQVHTAPGEFTEFVITLPRRQKQPSVAGSPPSSRAMDSRKTIT